MTKKPQTTPRKTPKQSRSASLVESILTASTRVFGKLNYSKTTTNKIAEVAGVSIGSLYQYFPGKEAIVRALIQVRIDIQLTTLEITLSELPDESLSYTIEKLIRLIAEPAYKNKNMSRLGSNAAAVIDPKENISLDNLVVELKALALGYLKMEEQSKV